MHGEYIEGIGIIIAVLLATTLAFVNEFKANKEFDILNQVSDDVPIQVIRNSQFTAVPRRDIVVGDFVLVEAGEEVPADGELVEAVAMLVNESGLTGESEPNHKFARRRPPKSQYVTARRRTRRPGVSRFDGARRARHVRDFRRRRLHRNRQDGPCRRRRDRRGVRRLISSSRS